MLQPAAKLSALETIFCKGKNLEQTSNPCASMQFGCANAKQVAQG